jgi:hypothetical protein
MYWEITASAAMTVNGLREQHSTKVGISPIYRTCLHSALPTPPMRLKTMQGLVKRFSITDFKSR